MSFLKDSPSSSYRSQKATASDLSVLEKLDTIPAIFTVAANAIFALFTGFTRAKDRRPQSYFNYVALTALRTFGSRTSVRQQHYLLPPTDVAYVSACKARHQTPSSLTLPDGTKAHWIGSSNASKLLLNFHGGGYVLPAGKDMFEFMFQIVAAVNAQRSESDRIACLMLAYDLAPGAIYPRQLQQAATLLNHVLTELKIEPENIVLSGDSAGGNLAVALLSHISHPHPSVSMPIPEIGLKKGEALRGACLISPWISFDVTAPSFQRNEYKDCVSQAGGTQWSEAFMACPWPHTAAVDNYNQAAMAPESWWNGLRVKNILIVAGEEEVLADGIAEFEAKLRKGVGKETNVEYFVGKGEFHDQPSIGLQLGYKEAAEGQQAKQIKRWIGSKL